MSLENTNLFVICETACRGEVDYNTYDFGYNELIKVLEYRNSDLDDEQVEELINEIVLYPEVVKLCYELIYGNFDNVNVEIDVKEELLVNGYFTLCYDELYFVVAISKEVAYQHYTLPDSE